MNFGSWDQKSIASQQEHQRSEGRSQATTEKNLYSVPTLSNHPLKHLPANTDNSKFPARLLNLVLGGEGKQRRKKGRDVEEEKQQHTELQENVWKYTKRDPGREDSSAHSPRNSLKP